MTPVVDGYYGQVADKEVQPMLVLHRGEGQSVRIGEEITVKVLHVGSGRVRLGIHAPEEIRIERGEGEPQAKPKEGRG